MKIEEAIETLEEKRKYCKMFYELSANPQEDYPSTAKFMNALELAITALRSVSREQELEAENKELKERIVNWRKYMSPTREQVEKVWRGEWMFPIFAGQKDANDPRCQCSECGSIETPLTRHRFCPNCGAPMTDEAVQMVMERLEALHGET